MIKDRIREDMKAAMRAHDAAGLSTIRLLLAAIKQREVDEQIEADDALILSVIAKMVKQRQDSVQQYLAGDRQDLADKDSKRISRRDFPTRRSLPSLMLPLPKSVRPAWLRWAR